MRKLLAQCGKVSGRDSAGLDRRHELAVTNPAFLLERLGSECTDLQGLLELTVNGVDAIAARTGEVISRGRVARSLSPL